MDKTIIFLGLTTQGSFHDYALFKEEFPPDMNWFSLLEIFVDLGYYGIEKDYKEGLVNIPHKTPRKSKTTPNPKLTISQKEENTQMSKIRIFIENAISGIKRYNILVNKYRNKRFNFEDDIIAICSGLWNLRLNNVII